MSASRPRALVFSIHPAPYQDPTFREVAHRGNLDFQVNYLFESNRGQPYLRDAIGFQYDVRILDTCRHQYPAQHDLTTVGQLISEYRPDVVFIPGYVHGTSRRALAYCISRGIPVVMVADSERKAQAPVWKRAAKNGVIRLLSAALSAAWVPGSAGRDYWTYYGMPAERVFEGCYCLDGPAIAGATARWQPERQRTRSDLGLARDAFVFLFVGRLIDQRGLQFLIRAFQAVRREQENAELLIVGDGAWRERIERHLKQECLRGITIIPPVGFTELPRLYAAADAYVQPSIYEPYSLSTAQAAVSALPIVATDCVGAVYDYMLDSQSGLVVRPRSADELARGMATLARDPVKSGEMGRGGQARSLLRTTQWAAEQFEAAALSASRN